MSPSSRKEVRSRIAEPCSTVEEVKMAGKIGSRGPSHRRDRMNIHSGTPDPPGLGPPVFFLGFQIESNHHNLPSGEAILRGSAGNTQASMEENELLITG